jgi:hypothetical protein
LRTAFVTPKRSCETLVKHGGVEVEAGAGCSAFHRWLLAQVLKVLVTVATEEEKNLVRSFVV